MEVDDIGTYLRIKKVSFDGKISEPITISKIDGGRNTGVPQLEIIDSEIFIVLDYFFRRNESVKIYKIKFQKHLKYT